uniref:Uncharacterized protein n=1 Tax=Globodera pallida TaxID=36090 RepID=A0A183BS99_GLOPA
MLSVLIAVPSLVFFISTHSVAHGGDQPMRCYQGIHGDVPEELAKTLLKEFNITANADMVDMLCPDESEANHCVQFECKGPGTKYFVFNTCHPRIYYPPYDLNKNKLKQNCNNGKQNDYEWCQAPNVFKSLCNNLSIPQNKRPKPAEVVEPPPIIYGPPPIICDGEMCGGGAAGLGASPAAICAVSAMLLLDHCVGFLRHYRRFD